MKEQAGEIVEYTLQNSQLQVTLPSDFWLKNKIYYYAVPRIIEGFKEIIISPILPKNWKYVWEFKFTIQKDKPGVIFSITDVLQENRINILKHEGYTPHENIEYSFWVLANIKEFLERENALALSRQEINELLSEKINQSFVQNEEEGEITEIDEAKIRLWSTDSLEMFYENNIDAYDNKLNEIGRKELSEFFEDPICFPVTDRKAEFPYSRLLNALGIKYNNRKNFFGTIFTDLEQRNFYILRFFTEKQKIIYFDVRHKHEVGVIYKLSREIYRDQGYNVLYNRAIVKKDTLDAQNNFKSLSHWYLLVEIKGDANVNELFDRLEKSPLTAEKNAVRVVNYTKGVNLDSKYRQQEKLRKIKKLARPLAVLAKVFFYLLVIAYLLIFLLNANEATTMWQENKIITFIFTIILVIVFYNGIAGGWSRIREHLRKYPNN